MARTLVRLLSYLQRHAKRHHDQYSIATIRGPFTAPGWHSRRQGSAGTLEIHGKLPKRLYVDKFSTYKVNHKNAVDDPVMITQFDRALREVGTELICAHSPQAKGRVERVFGTLQDRLVKEMTL